MIWAPPDLCHLKNHLSGIWIRKYLQSFWTRDVNEKSLDNISNITFFNIWMTETMSSDNDHFQFCFSMLSKVSILRSRRSISYQFLVLILIDSRQLIGKNYAKAFMRNINVVNKQASTCPKRLRKTINNPCYGRKP